MQLSVYFHREALDEARRFARSESRIAAALHYALVHGLERTAGSRLKRLRHLGTHTEKRLRIGSVRSVFSHVRNGDRADHQLAFVHSVGPRDQAYSRDHFRARIQHFHSDVWDREASRLRADLSELGYHEVVVSSPQPGMEEVCDLEPLLTPRQDAYCQFLLPLCSEPTRRDPFLIIGEGPPGSGKTLVVQEVALRAMDEENDVLVLVPSERLWDEYLEVFQSYGIVSGELHNGGHSEPQVFLHDVRRLFSDLAGGSSPMGERRDQVWQWWRRCLEQPRIHNLVRSTPGAQAAARQRRFGDLLDALYSDEEWYAADAATKDRRKKDDVEEYNAPSYALLRKLRNGTRWRAELNRLRPPELRLRCDLAREAAPALAAAANSTRPLLILIDECQDLIPIEWRVLLRWAHNRRKRVTPGIDDFQTRIAFVGDLNQRVSVTPFTWEALKDFAYRDLGVPEDMIVDRQIDTTSHRFVRAIGLAGKAVMDLRVTPRGKNRYRPVADPSQLADGGKVSVLVANDAWSAVIDTAASLIGDNSSGEHLCIIGGDERAVRAAGDQRANLHLYNPRTVKGLEFQTAVVVHPLDYDGGIVGKCLAFDQATTLYTAMTRARGRLLCVLSEREWQCLAKAKDLWADAGVADSLRTNGDLRRTLQELLPQFAQVLTIDELRDNAVKELRNKRTGPEEDEAKWIEDVLRTASKLVRLDGLRELAQEGAAIMLEWKVAAQATWERALAEQRGGDAQLAVACFVLLGEFAAARLLVEQLIARGSTPPCDVEVIMHLERESAWQPMLYRVRSQLRGPTVQSHELARVELARVVRARLSAMTQRRRSAVSGRAT